MIELKNVSKYYHNDGVTNRGLNNINLKFERNEIVVITGESGSGKSTLLNVITKQDTFDEGEIYYYGNETAYFSIDDMDSFRKNKIGFIFQNYNIIDSYTVLENVMLPLIINDVPYKEAKKEALEIIDKVGLTNWVNNRGTKLSGGQKQRCVIARALASKCEILACDEPTGNLDSETGKEIVKLIEEVAKDKLVLIVTHNYDQFKDIATRKINVFDGQIVEDSYIEKSTLDEPINMELDYIPVKNRVNFRIATNNLKSTPRKTFLMCTITLITAFFAFFLYQLSYYSLAYTYKENPLNYEGKDKIIAYDKLHNTLDLSDFNQENISTNVFYGDDDTSFYFDFINNCGYEPQFNEKYLDKYEGKLAKGDNELFLIVNDNYDYDVYKEYINYEIDLNNRYYNNYNVYLLNSDDTFDKNNIDFDEYQNLKYVCKYKIVGVGKSKYVSHSTITRFKKDAYLDMFFKYVFFQRNNNSSQFKVIIDRNSKTRMVSNKTFNYKYTYLDEFELFNKELPLDEIETSDKCLVIGNDIEEYENVYEAYIYGNKSNNKRKLNKLDYSFIDCNKFDTSTKMDRLVNNIGIYITVFGVTLVILIVYLIASIILLKVFSSKLDTYAIFRTLGVTRKDMKKILYIEVFLTVISMTIVNFIISIILSFIKVDNFFFLVYRLLSFKIIIIYFIIMIFIAFLLAGRFNKKLFKSSVSQTLREE